MWTNKQFWLQSSWRSFRTFCQALAGLLVTVQTASQISDSPISVPWYGYLYSSGIAALISLLQSVDRERAVEYEINSATPATAESAPAAVPADADYIPPATLTSGCGGDPR